MSEYRPNPGPHGLSPERREEIVTDTSRKLRRMNRDRWWWFRVVSGVLIAVLMTYGYIASQSALHEANSQIGQLQQQVRGLGGTPVAGPVGQTGATGKTGATGATGKSGPAPTAAQVLTAVDLYCAAHAGCANGPTQGQVFAAVKAYCAGRRCTGATGQTGQTGATGRAGASGSPGPTGAAGPGPTPGQVAEAVTAYCADNNQCRGAKGQAGDDGADGRGIASVDCTGLGINKLTIHYTTGPDQVVQCNP